MSLITISRKFEFDAGHRLKDHESQCRNLHGHRYKVLVNLTAPELDAVGRVIDFGALKAIFGEWLDENLDHAFISEVSDTTVNQFCIDNQFKLYRMEKPPTAENIAALLFRQFSKLISDEGVRIVAVTVWETPNCQAEYRPE